MRKSLLPLDELNALSSRIKETLTQTTTDVRDELEEEMIDLFLLSLARGVESANIDLDTDVRLDYDLVPEILYRKVAGENWVSRLNGYIDRPQRIAELMQQLEARKAEDAFDSDMDALLLEATADFAEALEESVVGVQRLLDTEMHRIYNEAQYSAAIEGGAKVKRWATLIDGRERDTHHLLNGVTIGADERFYSISGDSALHPGGFETAEENANCRCECVYSVDHSTM